MANMGNMERTQPNQNQNWARQYHIISRRLVMATFFLAQLLNASPMWKTRKIIF